VAAVLSGISVLRVMTRISKLHWKTKSSSTFRRDNNVRSHWDSESSAFRVAPYASFNGSHDRVEPL
jgi:hypothetical protein